MRISEPPPENFSGGGFPALKNANAGAVAPAFAFVVKVIRVMIYHSFWKDEWQNNKVFVRRKNPTTDRKSGRER